LTSALEGGEWSASRPGRFSPSKRAPGTHWIGGWVGPRAVIIIIIIIIIIITTTIIIKLSLCLTKYDALKKNQLFN
jgi:hypothetical protein